MKDRNMQYINRDAILKILSDNEVTKVSKEEEPTELVDGDEYIDLDHLEKGVQQVHQYLKQNTENVIPRSAVSEETWSKIIKKLEN